MMNSNSNPLITSMVLAFKETPMHKKMETKFLVQTKGKCTQDLILYTTDKLPEETYPQCFVSSNQILVFFIFSFSFSLYYYYHFESIFGALYKSFPPVIKFTDVYEKFLGLRLYIGDDERI